jgi:beta-lactam-binding protein with PASTA domain
MNGIGVMFLAFVTAVVTAAGTVYVIEQKQLFKAPVEQVAVPDLRGLTEGEARENLRALGLVYLAAPREASSASPGTVVRQSVPNGQSLPRTHPVTIVLADELPKVPVVTKLTQAEATARLQQAGYKVEVGPGVADDTQPDGTVVSQQPEAGTPYAKDRSVTLGVAASAEIEVPNAVGKNVNTIKTDLEKLGVKVVVRWVSVAETPTYIVLSQDPPAKTKVKKGASVQLSANR